MVELEFRGFLLLGCEVRLADRNFFLWGSMPGFGIGIINNDFHIDGI